MSETQSTAGMQKKKKNQKNLTHNEAHQQNQLRTNAGVRIQREGPQSVTVTVPSVQVGSHGQYTKGPNRTSSDESYTTGEEKYTDCVNGSLESAEKKIHELEGMAIESMQTETHREKELLKRK